MVFDGEHGVSNLLMDITIIKVKILIFFFKNKVRQIVKISKVDLNGHGKSDLT